MFSLVLLACVNHNQKLSISFIFTNVLARVPKRLVIMKELAISYALLYINLSLNANYFNKIV